MTGRTHERHPTVKYTGIDHLLDRGHGVVCVGKAPDGLPLLIPIPAPPDPECLLGPVIGALGVEQCAYSLEGTPLEHLAQQVDRLLKAHLIRELGAEEDGKLKVRVLPTLVSEIGRGTLLTRLNGAAQPVSLTAPHLSAHKTRVFAREQPSVTGPPRRRFKEGKLYLALPAVGGDAAIVRKELGPNGWPSYIFVRRYVEESIRYVGGTYVPGWSGDGSGDEPIPCDDSDGYRAARLDLPGAPWRWRVSRNKVARLVVEVVACLSQIHDRGEIHGDLKPSNLLISGTGMHAFDGLGLARGDRAPAMTRGWAAPEQVLGNPVSDKTDHYPVGLLLLGLLRGVLYGEEAKVLIPTGGTQLESHTVLRNPGVYIDPDVAPVGRSSVEDWRSLVERCVRFDPEERFPSTAALGDALKGLVERESFTGEIEVPLDFGSCVRGVGPEREPEPCWMAS